MSRLNIQESLDAMPTPGFQPMHINARNALARALRPDFVGLNPEDYIGVTDDHLDRAAPESLKSSLIGVSPASKDAVAYRTETNELMYIAVTPLEFGLMSGSVQALGERAVAGSQKKRQRPGIRSTVDDAAAVRAGLHAVTNRAHETERYLNNHLNTQDALIAKFQEAAQHPGLARFGSEGAMREKLTYLRSYVFGAMLTTIGNQRQWNPAQQERAQKAVDARLFLDRSHNNHLSNFKGMLDLAAEWNGYKRAIIATRLWQATQYTRKHMPNAN